MSTKSSFRAAFERREGANAGAPARSDFPIVRLLLVGDGPIARPIDAMLLMNEHGVSLKKARALVERLAAKRPVAMELKTKTLADDVIRSFLVLGIQAAVFGVSAVDVKRLREAQDLSQPDFALLYGLDVNTLKNWEQGRNAPDGPARVLLNIIEKHPEAELATLTRDTGET